MEETSPERCSSARTDIHKWHLSGVLSCGCVIDHAGDL